ncbi:tetratricopeptide repeat protein [Streptococcus fryi]
MTHSEQMLNALDNHDLDLANAYFIKALETDDERTLLDLGYYLESIGFFPQAKEIYLKFKDNYPELYLSLAQIANEDGQIEEAFLYLDAIAKDSPHYVNSLLIMADLYDSEGLSEVAREKLIEATTLTDEPLVTFGLAEIELSLEHYQEAIKLYASLDNRLILEETGISTYERIGKAYASLGHFETAISFLEKAVEIEFDEQTVFELATLLYEQEEYQKANLYYKQIATISPDFEGYHYAYAMSLKAEFKLEDAYRVAQEGLSYNAFDSSLLLLASQLAYETHDSQQSEAYLIQAKSIAEDSEEILLRLSTLYLEQERFEDLVDLDVEGIDNVITRWHIAKAYLEIDEADKALSIYEDIEELLKDNPEFLKDYIYLLREFGMRLKAVSLCERYLTLVPDDLELIGLLDELLSQ